MEIWTFLPEIELREKKQETIFPIQYFDKLVFL